MKATLTFSLPDEQTEFAAAVRGQQALSVLWELDQHCRATVKHGDPSPEVRQLCEHIREMIPGILLDPQA